MSKKTKPKKKESPKELEVGQTVMAPIEGAATGVSLHDAKQAIQELDRHLHHTPDPRFYFQVPPGDYIIVPRAEYEMFRGWWLQSHTTPSLEQQVAGRIQEQLDRVVRKPRPLPSDDQIKIEITKLAKDLPELDGLIKQVEAEAANKRKEQKNEQQPTDKREGTQGS